MSEHDSESEESRASASGEPESGVPRTQGKFFDRRALLKAALATTPVVMTIRSRPASAADTPSAAASARLSARPG